MQQAISYNSWTPICTNRLFHIINDQRLSKGSSSSSSVSSSSWSLSSSSSSSKNIGHVVLENAVVILVKRGCCMGHVIRQLLLTHGANPLIHEVDEANVVVSRSEKIVYDRIGEEKVDQFPVVFIGGKLFGGLEKVMSAHISGELVPVLKRAGALWL